MTLIGLTPHISNVCGQSGKVDTKGLVTVHARLVERGIKLMLVDSNPESLPGCWLRAVVDSLAFVKFMLSRFWSAGPAFPKLINLYLPRVQSCVVALATTLGHARGHLGSILFIPSTTPTALPLSLDHVDCASAGTVLFFSSEYDDIYIYILVYMQACLSNYV